MKTGSIAMWAMPKGKEFYTIKRAKAITGADNNGRKNA